MMTDTSILSTYDISIANAEAIEELCAVLPTKYHATFDTAFSFDTGLFETFRQSELNYFGPVLSLNAGDKRFQLTFLEFSSRQYGKRTTIFLDFQVWGIVTLKKEYPHILIRSETSLDKIHELIKPVELDFEDNKEFSRKFFVLADDKAKASLYLTPKLRELIIDLEVSEIIIEVKGNQLIIGNKKNIDTETSLAFAAFLEKVSRNF